MKSSDPSEQGDRQESLANGQSEEILEGGYVRALDEYFVEGKHKADTARRLAYSLVCILGGTVTLHYLTVLVLVSKGKADAVGSLAQIFNVWLPVIASLVSAAVTYYFTREK